MNSRLSNAYFWLTALLLITSAYWISVGTLQTGFLGEDFAYLQYSFANPKPWLWAITHTNEFGQFRPLSHQIFFLTGKTLFGLHSYPFHILQLSIHLANTGLLYTLARRLNPSIHPMYTALAALFWATLASHTKAIIWISATNNSLYVLFLLLLAHALLPQHTTEPHKPNYKKIILFSILALASKEFAIFIPLWILLFAKKSPQTETLLLTTTSIVILYFAYRFIFSPTTTANFSLSENFRPVINNDNPCAIGTYLWWSLESILLFAYFFLQTLIFQKPGTLKDAIKPPLKALSFFILFLLFLSLWPHHKMPEFLYVATLILTLCTIQTLLSKPAPKLLFYACIALIPIHWLEAHKIQQEFQTRAHKISQLKNEIPEIEKNLNSASTSWYWVTLNEKLGTERAHAVWFINLYFPERFPCLAENWRKSFQSGSTSPSTTNLTPSLFQCASSSK